MARTKDQWYETLKGWVPKWVFEEEKSNRAIFYGIARLLELVEQDWQNLFNQTMIDDAEAPYLDLHGDERSVKRITSELNAPYRIRIKTRSTESDVDRPSIQEIIDQIVTIGVNRIIEDHEGTLYADCEYFMDRGDICIDPIDHAFTIIFENQPDDSVFELVVQAVNRAKAFGVVYRVVERY